MGGVGSKLSIEKKSFYSSLPKSLTTVTSLSKFIAFVLFVTLLFVGFYLGMKYQKAPALINSPELFTVDKVMTSNTPEGTEIEVVGKLNMILISAGGDYEGPDSGQYLYGNTKQIYLDPQLEKIEINKYVVVKGKVGYCGGKKVSRYICRLNKTELLEQI